MFIVVLCVHGACMFVCVCVCVCVRVCVCFGETHPLSADDLILIWWKSIPLSAGPFVCLSVYLSACLSICLSICLSAHLSVYLSLQVFMIKHIV